MRLVQSDAIELSPWADDHDPLTTAAQGALPAFEQPAPISTPRRRGLFGRLNTALRRRWLSRRLDRLAGRLALLQFDMDEAAELAMSAAALNRHSPRLQALRQGLRAEHRRTYLQWLDVRQQLDNLQVVL